MENVTVVHGGMACLATLLAGGGLVIALVSMRVSFWMWVLAIGFGMLCAEEALFSLAEFALARAPLDTPLPLTTIFLVTHALEVLS